MAEPIKPEEYKIAQDDPLAFEHAAVASWIEEALASLGEHQYYQDVDLKSLPSGVKLLEAQPDLARRYVLAAVGQVRYWDHQTSQIRALAATEMERINAHHLPGWAQVWGRRRQAEAVISALMRRALPFERDDLICILEWLRGSDNLSTYLAPIGQIVRALKRYASDRPIDPDIRKGIKQFATQLRASYDQQTKRFGTEVEQLCIDDGAEAAHEDVPSGDARAVPMPGPAGCECILDELKRCLGMLPGDAAPSTTVIEPDRFALRDDSPLRNVHELLSALFEEVIGTTNYYKPELSALKAGQVLLALKPLTMGKALLAAAERHINSLLTPSANYLEHRVWQSRYAAAASVAPLMQSHFELDREGFFDLLLYLSARPGYERAATHGLTGRLIWLAEKEAAASPLSEGERYVLWLFRASLISGPPLGSPSDEVARLTHLIQDGANHYLVPGESWTDALNDDVSRLPSGKRQQWARLFKHALTATAARPSDKWLKTARKLADEIDGDILRKALERWLPLVTQGQTIRKLALYSGDARGAADVMNEENATCLRGLLWLAQALPNYELLARSITSVALSAYKKVPGVGPRAIKVGNAAVYALSQMSSTDAVGQLAMLKVRIKFGTAQKEIEKAFNKAAQTLGLPRDQIEEMGVPSYGLEEGGLRHEMLGDYRADLIVTGSDAQLKWSDANGKTLKAVPAKVKRDHKEDLKDLQQSLKDIQAMLPAQRDRIDSMFLLQKAWPIETWRERYLKHPLIGTISQRLLWRVDGTAALFIDGQPTDTSGRKIKHGKTAEITLWHPVGCRCACLNGCVIPTFSSLARQAVISSIHTAKFIFLPMLSATQIVTPIASRPMSFDSISLVLSAQRAVGKTNCD